MVALHYCQPLKALEAVRAQVGRLHRWTILKEAETGLVIELNSIGCVNGALTRSYMKLRQCMAIKSTNLVGLVWHIRRIRRRTHIEGDSTTASLRLSMSLCLITN